MRRGAFSSPGFFFATFERVSRLPGALNQLDFVSSPDFF
jgi:hypothetical protein